ncbi:MAG: hypothetical protein WBV22_09835, partial [Anaerolineaceae bacterium]
MMSENAATQHKPKSLWFHVAKLIRLRWLIFINGFKRAKPLRKFLTVFLGLLGLGASLGAYILTANFLKLLNSPAMSESGVNPGALMDALPSLLISGVFLAILLTSFWVLVQALYLARDMDFLLAAPIPIRAVFLTKLVDAILPNLALVLLIGLPVFFSLGFTSGYHFLYYPLVILVLSFLSLTAAGISSLVVMAVVRIAPAKRVSEVLAFVMTILFVIGSNWTNLIGGKLETTTPDQISKGIETVSRFNNTWSPLAWVGHGLVDIGEGRWLTGIIYISLTLVLSGGVFWLALNTSERLYHTGWASLQISTQRVKTRQVSYRRRTRSTKTGFIQRLVPLAVRAIMIKDFMVWRRDLRNVSQVIAAIIAGIVFGVMVIRTGGEPPAGKGEAPSIFMDIFRSALAYASMAISFLVGWMLIARLALVAFS